MDIQKPESFLTIRVHDLSKNPSLTGLCVGYDRGKWRESEFVDYAMEWLPEFALKESELRGTDSGNIIKILRKAAQSLYKSGKFKSRGEFGELFLHIAIREVFNSDPVISKIYYKSAKNDTVKGFDSVHVVETNGVLELWLGEVKFYARLDQAIKHVINEINDHTKTEYLRDEFTLISNKIDDTNKNFKTLKKLLSPNTSLDDVFERACIPVLLTYESKAIASHDKCTTNYVNDFKSEILAAYSKFSTSSLPKEIKVHLFLLPIDRKLKLITSLDTKLKTWQNI